MTQEEKQLLLQDLCARLPYSVRIYIIEDGKPTSFILKTHDLDWIFEKDRILEMYDYDGWKPYLRPMNSMTKEENDEYVAICTQMLNNCEFLCYQKTPHLPIDWLNAHHFDYRGLIPMGLALEAPEGMYNTKTE